MPTRCITREAVVTLGAAVLPSDDDVRMTAASFHAIVCHFRGHQHVNWLIYLLTVEDWRFDRQVLDIEICSFRTINLHHNN